MIVGCGLVNDSADRVSHCARIGPFQHKTAEAAHIRLSTMGLLPFARFAGVLWPVRESMHVYRWSLGPRYEQQRNSGKSTSGLKKRLQTRWM